MRLKMTEGGCGGGDRGPLSDTTLKQKDKDGHPLSEVTDQGRYRDDKAGEVNDNLQNAQPRERERERERVTGIDFR